MSMQKILIADDEELIRKLVCDFLVKNGYEALQAEDGEEALRLFEENKDIALIILDIMMPNMDGWECCRRIRKLSGVPIIMLTARSQEFDELMGFEAGADDYVTKPFSPTVLMMRIATMLKRNSNVSVDSVIELDGLKLDQAAHGVWIKDKSITLTLKEYSILLKLLTNKERVFTREQLLDDIWGFDFYGDIRTVDSHVARLRTKLGDWGVKHIKTIYGTGYKIDSD
ncbi:MAG: response regulator transcription factor [Clostridia bacterium]|nr:response regulator transcription factor [Clostridia bacterium]MBQ9879839.1 response regulator transcription factor [Clostridia bacterium]MCR5690340.1 response regulator transcription factor [Clostridiales bacterium]